MPRATIQTNAGPATVEVPEVGIVDFRGLVSNLDPRDLPPGASVHQVNVVGNHPSELRVRGGTRLVAFD